MTFTSATGAPVAPESTPPAGEPTTDATAPVAGANDAGQEPADVGTLQRELSVARKDAARYREQLRTREEADKATEEANKSELTRATERVSSLESELAAERSGRQVDKVRLATLGAASKLGFRNPTIAYQLVDMAAVTFDEAGEPTNIDAILGDIAKANDYLVGGKPDFGGGPRGPQSNRSTDMNDAIRRAAGRG